MTGYLIAEEGPLAGLIVPLEDREEWTLGRDPDEASIVLEDPQVSRKHAICQLTAEGYTLENLSSVNPVTQNGKVLTEKVLLRENDILQIGSTFFRFSEKATSEGETLTESTPLEEEAALSSVEVGHPKASRWFLKVVSGPNSGAEFSLQEETTYILGKDPNLCDIVFQDLSVSRQHARLVANRNAEISIEDLSSRNQTWVNSAPTAGVTLLASQDLISLGTTSFLLIDREAGHETLFSAPLAQSVSETSALAAVALEPQDWKETIIPKKHLIVVGCIAVCVLGGVASLMALFQTQAVPVHVVDEPRLIKEALQGYEDIQYSYNASVGKILLVGHVLTAIDKQELLYKVRALSFVQSIEDAVIIDEYVWENINALLTSNPSWVGVSLYSPSAGRFVLRGYLQSLDQLQALSDYINLNFPYLDRLDNQVVIETNLELQIQSMLVSKGFGGVSFQINNGEIVLGGRVDNHKADAFADTVEAIKKIRGIRLVKNFVVLTTTDTSQVDLSSQYKISGYSKQDDREMFVVINGKIFSIGDLIDGMKIVSISSTAVFLEKGGLKFRINYNLQ